MTDVTVCITHVSREGLLNRCLNALKENAGYPFKTYLICVGDRVPPVPNWVNRVEHKPNQGIGKSRREFADSVDTEFMMILDNDTMIYKNCLNRLMIVIKEHPELGVLTSFIKLDQPGLEGKYVADLSVESGKTWKNFVSFKRIRKSGKKLWYADFVAFGCSLFRTKALNDIEYDPDYPIGYEHWDACLQFKKTDWKLAVLAEELFEHVTKENPHSYNAVRYNKERLAESKAHFIEKWGLEPIVAGQ